jgi:hypothetical protein
MSGDANFSGHAIFFAAALVFSAPVRVAYSANHDDIRAADRVFVAFVCHRG